jgi:hypothetical protein
VDKVFGLWWSPIEARTVNIISKMVYIDEGDASGYAENKNNADCADGFECSLDAEFVDCFMNSGMLIKASAFCRVHDDLAAFAPRLGDA